MQGVREAAAYPYNLRQKGANKYAECEENGCVSVQFAAERGK